ncbi:glycoside hydrolase superfamily [Dunaliella salina]|uniref:Glycoside hydrolase superfamily n=1 Tax=Dunaliella salina TaxID=3046 RepID=A0ABQ7GKT2_DUNSA|nr:glycoside hydrolase superfamily [Dunaliella salina]|eukprot:KAF5835118.1 glycoside hydrolase superfamily [Dunaliella salina]
MQIHAGFSRCQTSLHSREKRVCVKQTGNVNTVLRASGALLPRGIPTPAHQASSVLFSANWRHARRSSLAPAAAVQAPSALQFGSTQDEHAHRFITKQGSTVSAMVVSSASGGAQVLIFVQGSKLPKDAASPPNLHWGMYRAVRSQWHHPKDAVPPGSTLDQATKGMRTPLSWQSTSQSWVTTLSVPVKLLPLSLAMVLYFPDTDSYDNPRHGSYMAVPLGMDAGTPSPAGASIVAVSNASSPQQASCTVNFAVFSRHAASISLCIVRVKPGEDPNSALQGSGVLEIALDPVTNKTGDMWHVCVTGLKDIGMMCYGWRADGDTTWETGGRYHPGFILCDPHAVRAVPVLLPESAYTNAARMPPKLDLSQPVVLASLSAFVQDFNWRGMHIPLVPGLKHLRGARPLEQAVWVELDIPTFTAGPEAARAVPLERQGKYLGILDRLQELVDGGVTGVLLGPCCLSGPGMGPYGRSPLSLMAPDPQFAQGGNLTAAAELKTVIKALHAAGVEVLMSVEFCITAEGSDAGRRGGLQGMRGLDAAVYYRTMPSGTAVLAAGHPSVRPMIMDSLRHWALEYQLDGFCFVNAENLVQDRFGTVLDNPPLAEDICHDPVLRGLKLVAAPGDSNLLPRNGVRGFPHWGIWMQLNDQFRNDARAYLIQNQPGLLSALATRIAGSADLFAPVRDDPAMLPGGLAVGRRASFGVNTMAGLGDRMLLEVRHSSQAR